MLLGEQGISDEGKYRESTHGNERLKYATVFKSYKISNMEMFMK